MSACYVILDCDGGSDDAWALLLLLRAEEAQLVRLLAITICGCGNTDLFNASRNMYRILKASKRTDIPIYLGASEALIPPEGIDQSKLFHGTDGFGDVLKDHVDFSVDIHTREAHAVNAINNLCRKHPGEVTLIGVGPLTNFALCYSMFGEQFANDVKSIYIMGGNYQGVGNFTRAAEFNFYCDPEAAHIVLQKAKCSITILPWEPCLNDRFCISIDWRFKEFGNRADKCCAPVELLNIVEHAQWSPTNFTGWNPCDAMLVASFLFDSKIVEKSSRWHATVDLTGHTRGQMVLDHLHDVDKYPENVQILEVLNAESFKNTVEWAAHLKDL